MTTTKKKAKAVTLRDRVESLETDRLALLAAASSMKQRLTVLAAQVNEVISAVQGLDMRLTGTRERLTALEQAQSPASSAPAELSRLVDDIKNLRPVPGDMLRAAERVLDAEEDRLRDAVVDAAMAWGGPGWLGPGRMIDATAALRAHRAKKGGA